MKKRTYSIAAAQKDFAKVVRASEKGALIPIERRGEAVAYVISKDRFDAVLETMELLSNPGLLVALRKYETGKTKWTSLEDLPECGGTGRPNAPKSRRSKGGCS